MNKQEAAAWVKDQPFTFAKTYANSFPHSYLKKTKVEDKDKFIDFLKLIRKEGEVYTFFKKQYVYLELDGIIYWEVGRPIPAVLILNGAPKETLEVNGQKRASKEVAYELKTKLAKPEKFLEELMLKEEKTEQDQKRVSFLMNQTRRIHGGGKNIIDSYTIPLRYE